MAKETACHCHLASVTNLDAAANYSLACNGLLILFIIIKFGACRTTSEIFVTLDIKKVCFSKFMNFEKKTFPPEGERVPRTDTANGALQERILAAYQSCASTGTHTADLFGNEHRAKRKLLFPGGFPSTDQYSMNIQLLHFQRFSIWIFFKPPIRNYQTYVKHVLSQPLLTVLYLFFCLTSCLASTSVYQYTLLLSIRVFWKLKRGPTT